MKQVCKIASSSRCIGLAAVSSPAIQVKVNDSDLCPGHREIQEVSHQSTKEMCTSISDIGESNIVDSHCFPPRGPGCFSPTAQKRCTHLYQILERVALLILTAFHLFPLRIALSSSMQTAKGRRSKLARLMGMEGWLKASTNPIRCLQPPRRTVTCGLKPYSKEERLSFFGGITMTWKRRPQKERVQ